MGDFPQTKMKELFVLLLCVALFTSCNRDKKVTEYGYVFEESTGDNRFILTVDRIRRGEIFCHPENLDTRRSTSTPRGF